MQGRGAVLGGSLGTVEHGVRHQSIAWYVWCKLPSSILLTTNPTLTMCLPFPQGFSTPCRSPNRSQLTQAGGADLLPPSPLLCGLISHFVSITLSSSKVISDLAYDLRRCSTALASHFCIVSWVRRCLPVGLRGRRSGTNP